MGRQDLADALDAELRKRLLPTSAVHAIRGWLAGVGARYATGTSNHCVRYVPAHWAGITPWPDQFLEQSHTENTVISRAQVVAVAREAVKAGEWAQALVASYVWGQGRTGYGPHRLKEILSQPNASDALAEAGATLQQKGAVAAYRGLYGTVRGLGPAFFTKLLYFLDLAMDTSAAPHALILDQRVARVVRSYATRVGRETGLASAPDVAAWTWSDSGWTPHRYEVYLDWITAAADQLASSAIGWPGASPDLLELALFDGAWDPTA
ncbi:8-oxoguanine DNA glycosylase OGG fold protein [Streptomyces hydrogenans]|uniref:8-oxoguanine DNA glycosylase OGG fold protein n=1 Tax=Streptomyces hydrogenans TaxID=1873719 RepID=UPI003804237F